MRMATGWLSVETSVEEPVLRVGDTVIWLGAWGSEKEQNAVVTEIEKTAAARQKYGEPVRELPWSEVERSVVTLSNGHWAYGFQLRRLA
jgi:hypothetical protein